MSDRRRETWQSGGKLDRPLGLCGLITGVEMTQIYVRIIPAPSYIWCSSYLRKRAFSSFLLHVSAAASSDKSPSPMCCMFYQVSDYAALHGKWREFTAAVVSFPKANDFPDDKTNVVFPGVGHRKVKSSCRRRKLLIALIVCWPLGEKHNSLETDILSERQERYFHPVNVCAHLCVNGDGERFSSSVCLQDVENFIQFFSFLGS